MWKWKNPFDRKNRKSEAQTPVRDVLKPRLEEGKRCQNCFRPLGKDDTYCKICGAPVMQGPFDPARNADFMRVIYGPPPALEALPKKEEEKPSGRP